MNLVSYIIWNASPDIFTVGPITLRWYGLLFALGFLLSQQILYYIFKKEGKPEKDVDTLTIYMVIATIVGARLGHVLFYEPARYLENPIDILKIWQGGLASHGAAVGILVALWLYARKRKPGQNYFQTLDRIVILVALTGALIRLGNFYNSEIIGKQTQSNKGVLFVRNVTELLSREPMISEVSYIQAGDPVPDYPYPPLKILIDFQRDKQDPEELHAYLNGRIFETMMYRSQVREHITFSEPLNYHLAKDESGRYAAVVYMYAVARHPAQLYEAISCFILFGVLFWMWYREREKLAPGRLFGIFLIVCFGLRFFYEYLKEVQVSAEYDLIATYGINYGQIYSIPLVLAGVLIVIWSFRKKGAEPDVNP